MTAIPLSLDEARRSRSQSVTLNSDPKKLTQAVSESRAGHSTSKPRQLYLKSAAVEKLYSLRRELSRSRRRQPTPPFPLFQLTDDEVGLLRRHFGTSNAHGAESLRSQFGTSKGRGGRRYLPYAFTEQGVAMLSSVLRSPRAVQVNIEIMRAFVRLRQMLQQNTDLARKLAALERKYDGQFKMVFEAIRDLMTPAPKEKPRIGFRKGGS